MNDRPSGADERRARALRCLAQLAAQGAGYELRGVRGWAHPDDVQARLGGYRWAECLGAMAESGHLDRVLVSASEAERPSFVYRIAETGLEAARPLLGTAAPSSVPAPGPPEATLRVHVGPGGRFALEALRDAYRRGPKPHRMHGEPGWLTPSELREPVDTWNRMHGSVGSYRSIQDTDIVALLKTGLIEKTHVTLAWGRERPVVLYRATDTGLTVELLEWDGPEEPGETAEKRRDEEPHQRRFPSGVMFGGGQ